MNLVRLEISDVRLKKCDVPDEADTALTARLFNIARVTNGKGPARVRLSSELALRPGNFDLQSFLRLFLIYRTDALSDPNSRYLLSMNLRRSAGVRVVAMSSSSHKRLGDFQNHIVVGPR